MDFGLTKEQVDILFSGNDELSAAIVDATKSNNGLYETLYTTLTRITIG